MFMLYYRRRVSGRTLTLCASLLLIGGLLSGTPVWGQTGEATENLTLPQALARVLRDSPELAVYPYQLRAAEALALQAGLRPNPELSIEMENFSGDNEFSGTDSAELTLALSQVIELGGKRRYRREAARLGSELVQRDYEMARLEVLGRAAERFLDVVQAQQLLQLAEQSLEWAQKAEQVAQTRLKAGSASRAEVSQIRLEALRAELTVSEVRNSLDTARLQLAGQWGAQQADFASLSADVFSLSGVPAFEQLRAQLEKSPQLQQFLTLERLRKAELNLAIAEGRQDLNVGVGTRRFEETGDKALTFSLSIPLGISNRNQGEIAAARAGLEQLDSEWLMARTHLYNELHRLYREMQQARRTVELLQQQALPEASQALEQIEKGYRGGRFSYLELIEIRRQRLAVELDAIDAAVKFHRTLLTLEQLTGEPLTAMERSIIQIKDTTQDDSK
jgi:cobalt-zinc-cadmium efflux system outer membrane protein